MKTNPPNATQVEEALRTLARPERAASSARFFKTGPGEYGEGDRFLGIKVPEQRAVVKQFRGLPLKDAITLLHSPFHEVRLTALLIMVELYRRGDAAQKQAVFNAYLASTKRINNWDLVDSSAHLIVGPHIQDKPRPLLRKLIASPGLWERRIGVLATFHFIRLRQAGECLWVAKELLHDKEDLIHKAVGWMLREVGKHVDVATLHTFLDQHAAVMPRTMLRYAIERLGPARKTRYMNAGK